MFKPEGFSDTIRRDRYALTPTETWEEGCSRLAYQMALAENPLKAKEIEDRFYNILINNYFVPGGRIWYSAGRLLASMLNCFVLGDKLDSKEGWGQLSKEMIITSMAQGGCGIDFSDVRPEGAEINGQRGSCPGPIELAKLINNNAEPIRAGGQRRVALMFSLDLDHPDIMKFLDAKLKQGELSYANISVRSKNTTKFIDAVRNDKMWELSWKGKYKTEIRAKDLWNKIVTNAYNSAEPGFLNMELAESESNIHYISSLVTTNPCQPAFAKILTPEGIRTFADITIGSTIWSGTAWTKVVNKWKTGVKPVYKYTTTTGNFVGTENHRILENSHKIEVKNAASIDWNVGPNLHIDKSDLNPQDIIDGLVLGDGSVHKASNNLVHLYIGSKDTDYFNSEINTYITKHRPGLSEEAYEINTTITFEELPKTFLRVIPDRFYFGAPLKKAGFLRGLFSANGSISGNRVTLKQSSKVLIQQVQEMLSSLGIHSYITTNKAKLNEFSNGNYEMKESYDINITSGRSLFKKSIGFIQNYKQEKIIEGSIPKYLTSDIKEIEYLGDFEVYDITVNAEEHTYWSGGCLVSNCGEQFLTAYDNCCLGHLVLTRFVDNSQVNWHLMADVIRASVRFLDNVLTVNAFPMPEMKEVANKLRRIGLGATGLADMLAMLGLRYGSSEANKFVDKLFKFISKAAYEASIMLAIEKGAFPACIPKKHIESGYIKKMSKKIQSLILEHGIRNSCILTIAPTGTTSILSGNCSSGIEPMFAPAYERRYWKDNERKTELVFHPLFVELMQANKDVSHLIAANELTVKDHLEVQKIVQKHIDSAVSKTINMPENYSIEDMSNVWLEYLPNIKGTTFYRENSRGYVDSEGKIQEPPLKAISIEEAKVRFTESYIVEAVNVKDCINGTCEI